MDAETFAGIEVRNSLGRAGTPEDAANAVYLFCAPESDFISGQSPFPVESWGWLAFLFLQNSSSEIALLKIV